MLHTFGYEIESWTKSSASGNTSTRTRSVIKRGQMRGGARSDGEAWPKPR